MAEVPKVVILPLVTSPSASEVQKTGNDGIGAAGDALQRPVIELALICVDVIGEIGLDRDQRAAGIHAQRVFQQQSG